MADQALTLNPLTLDDVAAALRLSEEARWNQTARDWRLMITHGHAVGLFEPGGALVATAIVFPFEDRLAWISMVLVTRARRRQGHASQLLQYCTGYIEGAGMIAVLDATEAGRKVYAPLGFTDLYPISRWEGSPPTQATAPPTYEASAAVRPLPAEDLDGLAAWDRVRFGAGRAPVLRHLRQAAPHLAHVAEDAGGNLVGYGLGRPGRLATQLGPVVADDAAVATLLMRHAVEKITGLVYVDVPDAQTTFKQMLIDAGFTRQRRFIRMVKGDLPALDQAAQIYAIAGPELG